MEVGPETQYETKVFLGLTLLFGKERGRSETVLPIWYSFEPSPSVIYTVLTSKLIWSFRTRKIETDLLSKSLPSTD